MLKLAIDEDFFIRFISSWNKVNYQFEHQLQVNKFQP